MGEYKRLDNQKFGMLTVIKRSDDKILLCGKKQIQWECVCDCGKTTFVSSGNLSNNHTKSCGCLLIKSATELNTSHGLSKTRFYQTWRDVLERTGNPHNQAYERYGGRGIKVCDKWSTFEGFLEDMYESYLEHSESHGEKQTTIDRINNDGNYEKNNCKWSTYKEQALNRCSNKKYLVNGEMLTVTGISEKYNLTYSTVIHRISRKWPLDKITQPQKIRGDNIGIKRQKLFFK